MSEDEHVGYDVQQTKGAVEKTALTRNGSNASGLSSTPPRETVATPPCEKEQHGGILQPVIPYHHLSKSILSFIEISPWYKWMSFLLRK